MYELYKWLDNQNFFRGIELLEKYAPAHAILESLKESNASTLDRLYLKAAIKELYESLKNQQAVSNIIQSREQPLDRQHFQDLEPKVQHAIMEKTLRQLHQDRAMTSNKFHNCTTNHERALISDKLNDLIIKINEEKARINYYKKHGTVPPRVNATKDFKIPESDVNLLKQVKNYRSKSARKQRLIDDFVPSEKQYKTLEQHQTDLVLIQQRLKLLEAEKRKRKI